MNWHNIFLQIRNSMILIWFLLGLVSIHNIDVAYNRLYMEKFLCDNNMTVQIDDCNLTGCETHEQIFMKAITLLLWSIVSLFVLGLTFVFENKEGVKSWR